MTRDLFPQLDDPALHARAEAEALADTAKERQEQIAQGTVVLGDDFSQHRITGVVTHAPSGVDPRIDIPLISHAEGALYQGGCMNGVRLPDGFDFVVSLYPWEKYALGPDTVRVEYQMYDALDQTFEAVDDAAYQIADHLTAGEAVLVHCQAGLNRSGLVAARVLMMRGHTAEEAIALLRRQRSPLVLCNQTFERHLLEFRDA
jgi:hypothetical protein